MQYIIFCHLKMGKYGEDYAYLKCDFKVNCEKSTLGKLGSQSMLVPLREFRCYTVQNRHYLVITSIGRQSLQECLYIMNNGCRDSS